MKWGVKPIGKRLFLLSTEETAKKPWLLFLLRRRRFCLLGGFFRRLLCIRAFRLLPRAFKPLFIFRTFQERSSSLCPFARPQLCVILNSRYLLRSFCPRIPEFLGKIPSCPFNF